MDTHQAQMKNFLKLPAYEMRKTRHRHCPVMKAKE